MRTLLTILGVGVGIGAVLFLVSLGYGLQKALLEQITTDESLLSITVSNPTSEVIYLTEEKIDEFSKISGVKEISPLASFTAQITMGDLTGNIILNGVDTSYFKYAGIVPIKGETFLETEEDKILISEATLKLFNIEQPEQILGKEIDFQIFVIEEEIEKIKIVKIEKSFEIKGIIEGEETSFVYFPLSRLKEEISIQRYEMAQIRIIESQYIEKVKEEVMNKGFLVASLSETIEEADKIFRAIQIVLGLFGMIALFVSAIGMANTMTVTLLERTNEIGIMKSIGASDKDIEFIFLGESVIMGFFGGIAGIVIGIGAGGIFNFGINILASNLGGQSVDLFFSPFWFIITIIIFSTLIGFITGIFPARHASRLNPLEALRYK